MQILLTNDDGIQAPGIRALHAALKGLGEITVVAPYTVQSATSHGVTFHEPLMRHDVMMDDGTTGYAIDGRPADCVKVALRHLWEELHGEGSRPDVTISGMNAGSNVGINVIYSGTVAAALESAFEGVPSIAVSLHLGDRNAICFDRAAEIARAGIDRVLEHPRDPHSVVNINVPRTESEDAPMPEIRVVEMNTAPGLGHYEQRTSPDGHVYYWAAGDGMKFAHTREGTDVEGIFERYMTLTPLQFDMTDHARMQTWRERLAP
ncbi:MAG: 5'/3'-nucleotidase SurE [Phycisphaerales bacterium]|nr:5'/3'-nucleotidase SurE [Phycisphaerales bacterium]